MTQRDKILREVQQTLGGSPKIKFVASSETDINQETISRFKTPLAILSPGDVTLTDPRIGAVKRPRQTLPLQILLIINKTKKDETEALNDLEFEVKRLMYKDRRRGTYAISTDYQSRGALLDLFEESIYAGFAILFNILYEENLEV